MNGYMKYMINASEYVLLPRDGSNLQGIYDVAARLHVEDIRRAVDSGEIHTWSPSEGIVDVCATDAMLMDMLRRSHEDASKRYERIATNYSVGIERGINRLCLLSVLALWLWLQAGQTGNWPLFVIMSLVMCWIGVELRNDYIAKDSARFATGSN